MACYNTAVAAMILLAFSVHAGGQDIPRSSARPWQFQHQSEFAHRLENLREQPYAMDANHTYTLAELVDLAESHNPDTRVAWQNAKTRAEFLGIAKSELFPTISAVALARTLRVNDITSDGFSRDTLGLFQPALNLSYLIFDVGGRSGAINAARAERIDAPLWPAPGALCGRYVHWRYLGGSHTRSLLGVQGVTSMRSHEYKVFRCQPQQNWRKDTEKCCVALSSSRCYCY